MGWKKPSDLRDKALMPGARSPFSTLLCRGAGLDKMSVIPGWQALISHGLRRGEIQGAASGAAQLWRMDIMLPIVVSTKAKRGSPGVPTPGQPAKARKVGQACGSLGRWISVLFAVPCVRPRIAAFLERHFKRPTDRHSVQPGQSWTWFIGSFHQWKRTNHWRPWIAALTHAEINEWICDYKEYKNDAKGMRRLEAPGSAGGPEVHPLACRRSVISVLLSIFLP